MTEALLSILLLFPGQLNRQWEQEFGKGRLSNFLQNGDFKSAEAFYQRHGAVEPKALGNIVAIARYENNIKHAIKCCDWLFARGANVDAGNGRAIANSIFDKTGTMTTLLVKKGADVNLFDPTQDSPLFLALTKKHTKVVRILLQNGANPNLQSGQNDESSIGLNPAYNPKHMYHKASLMLAAQYGNEEYAGLLIHYGAKLNTQQKYTKFTALHWAVRNDHASMVAYLLRKGANRNLRDANGRTPLQLAQKLKAKKSISKLRQ